MCSRMVAIRLLNAFPNRLNGKTFLLRHFTARNPTATRSPAEPATHAGRQHHDEEESAKGSSEPVIKKTPLSSPKLESTHVNNQPINPKTQQKRTMSSLDEVSCVGIDGFPSPETGSGKDERDRDRKEQEMDDKEYFKHHKASPLSEIEIADTRKPVTQATDSKYKSGDGGIITWLPEQLISADETLRLASEIFKQNAMRGDPDSPHGRRLRELRGEWW